ncbi:filamentous hemagglutinin N-terminal domain-containing protein [Bradyrhizobium tropiciagri]|uniref:MBG domain-containing protein n=1 Tax=Bradyrhizobium tropiciagri TaxID=312253 RepID=UPI001BA64537|nr:MBG domain-containing protein [Bradyrhizobium tropiciagri]MBR0893944.1 filamentous hemagglutinin N-terminal domain-containing protein [Bradyrhizobium tropiciagri]
MDVDSLTASQRHRLRASRLALLLATSALTAPGFVGAVAAQNLPTGGSVAAGSATVSQPSPTSLGITQSSQSAVVNWQSFSVGQGYSVNITQPNASSALLNRVTGSTPSTIAGSLTANGQVYLVNPNGIAITPTGTVNVGGGFVASTLGISDADFMSGKRSFSGNGASAAVSNAGTITVGRGGYAALIGGTVSNSGNIYVPLGKVGLGSGEQATLDFSGDGFLQVALPTNARPGKADGALIENAGTIKADGGAVIMNAATAREAARNAINISGVVQARSIGGKNGAIEIGGGEGGQVTVSGKLTTASHKAKGGTITVTGKDIALRGAQLDASGRTGGGNIRIGGDRQGGGTLQRAQTTTVDAASTIKADSTGTGDGGNVVVWSDVQTSFAGTISAKGGVGGGNGGEAEVSGKAKLGYTGFTNLSAAKGSFGTLLLDPYNVTISNAVDSNQAGFTATGDDSIINVGTLQTALSAANVTVATGSGGSQAGDITVAAPIAWSSGSTLTLNAYRNITVDAPVTINGSSGLTLSAGGGVQVNKTISVTGAGAVSITAAPVTDVSTTGLTFALGASIDYGAINNGGTFTLNGKNYTLVYSMANFDAIDGINSTNGATIATYGAGITGNYALATNLDASGITYNQQLMGGFGGMLDGLGHTVSNLTIGGGLSNNGMIGVLFGTLSNFGMVGGSVNGNLTAGTLAGSNNGGVVQTSYSSATIYGSQDVGGLVGFNTGTIQSSFATGNVTTGSQYGGGLVGRNTGLIKNSFASGTVSAGQYVGGLVGRLEGGSIQQSLFTGLVINGGGYAGGIVGYVPPAVPFSSSTNLYWDAQTSGTSAAAGYMVSGAVQATGLATAQLQDGTQPAGLSSAIWGTGAGLYPYLKTFYPAGPQVLSGTAYSDGGSTGLAGGSIGLIANGANLGTVSTGANGYYYFSMAPGTLSNGATLLSYSNANSATLTMATGAAIRDGVNLYGQTLTASTSATLLSNVKTNVAAAAGGNAAAIAAINATTLYDVTATGASFTVNQTINASSFAARTTTAGAPLIVSNAITIQDGGSLTLNSAGALRFNAPVTMQGASTAALGYDASDPANLTFAIGAPLTYTNADGSAAAASAGGSLSINGQGYQLLYTMNDLPGMYGGSYALVNSLSPTSSYSDAVVPHFYGVFEGLGHTITGLTVSGSYAGLFGIVQGGTVRDIGMIGGSVIGTSQVGALAATAESGSIIANAYASTSVALNGTAGTAGGLIGSLDGTLVNSFATGDVTAGVFNSVGGLIGYAFGSTVRDVFATGSVTGGTSSYVGGLIGYGQGGSLTNAYATGAVAGSTYAGALIGLHSTVLTNGYADTTTSGTGPFGWVINATGSATSLSTADLQSGAASGLGNAFVGGANGLYPYLKSFFPNGVQVVSGYAVQQDGSSPWRTTVSVANGGALVGTSSTGVNGYYYVFAPAGTASNASGVAASTSDSNGAIAFRTGAVGQLTTNLNLTDGWRRDTSDSSIGSLSALNAAFSTAVGSTAASSVSPANRQIDTVASSFALDQAFSLPGTLSLSSSGTVTQSAAVSAGGLLLTGPGSFTLGAGGNQIGTLAANVGDLTVVNTGNLTIGTLANAPGATTGGVATSGGVSVSTNGDLTIASDVTVSGTNPVLAATGAFINNRGSDAVTATSGRWLVYSADPTGNTFGGLDSGNTAIFGNTFATLAPGSIALGGNRYIFSATRTLTVTSTDASKTYGDDASAAIAGNYVITGYDPGVAGAYLGDSAATAHSGTASITSTGADVTADVAGSPYIMTAALGTLTSQSGYGFSFVSDGRLTVNQRAITVTADAKSRYYGDANPVLTYAVGGLGLVNSDTLNGSLDTSATTASGIGAYGITQGTLSNNNYAITYTGANLSVTARPITITADAKSRYYGDTNPALTYSVGGPGGGPGLVNGDTLSGALTTSAMATSGVGGYGIVQGSLGASSNYAVSYVAADLTVTPRPITVTANAQSKVYGAADPELSYTVGGNGLANGDTLSGLLSRTAGENVIGGGYAIGQGSVSNANNPNYAITYTGNTLTITPATLTYVANAATRQYGDANPALSGTVSGFVNGDTQLTTVTGTLTFATGANGTSGVGGYAITGSGLTLNNGNYVLAQAAGNATALSITPRAITVTADAQSRTYGDTNPALSYAIGGGGLVNGDTLSGNLASLATTTSNVGGYAITQGSLAASSNYALTYTGATLTVTPRAITVTADARSRIYGDANPAFSYSLGGAGLVNGDTLSGSLVSAANAASNVGNYAITQGSLAASSNYALTYTGATLAVTPRTITVSADAASRIYGDANFLSYTVGGMGLVNGDTLSGSLFTSATATSNVGSYAITQGSLAASSNYTLAGFTGSTLNVTQRPITVIADAKTKFNGEPNPALTYVIGGRGLVNGDTLTGALATTADTNSLVGSYAITQGSVAASANYLLTYVGTNLIVQPRPTLNYSAIIDRILAANATPIELPVGATAIGGAPQIATANGLATFYADPRSDRALVCFGTVCFSAL